MYHGFPMIRILLFNVDFLNLIILVSNCIGDN